MTVPDGDSPVEQALTAAHLCCGLVPLLLADERWEWSPRSNNHGYQPGTVTPTTQLVLSHKHPDDYHYIAATLDDIRRTHKPLSTRHRIITVQGETRDVVIIGERLHDDDTGEVIEAQGFYLDVTPTNEERQANISQALIEIAENRASIEQAKGVLMYIYGIGPDAAFDLLRWRSQEGNVKLRALAEQVLADVLTRMHDKGAPLSRQTFDELSRQPTNAWQPKTPDPFRSTGSAYAEFVLGELVQPTAGKWITHPPTRCPLLSSNTRSSMGRVGPAKC